MSTRNLVFALVFIFLWAELSAGLGNNQNYLRHEKHVLDWIRHVPREIIPHTDNGDPLVVYHMISLGGIVNLDTEKQVLELSGWTLTTWVDQRLAWDIEPFIQVDVVNVPFNMVWTADMILYSSAELPHYFPQATAHVLKNGTVSIFFPSKMKSYCPVPDVIEEGDNVTCTLQYGSWNHDLRFMELKPLMPAMFRPFYTDFNKQWMYIDSTSKQVRHIKEGPFDFTTVDYTITIQKK